ncbi:unnamed protein product [Ixodes hexagonus]
MDISESVGMGLWQLPPALLTFYRGVPSAMLMMAVNFAAPKIQIWCKNDMGENGGFTKLHNLSAGESLNFGECWTKRNGSMIECKSWEFDHSVFSWTLNEEFNLVCERAWLRPISQSFYLTGMLMGNFIFSHLSDRHGRRISIFLSSAFMLIFGFMCAFSTSMTMYNLTRVLASLGTGGIQSTSITLFMEAVPSRNRILFVLTYGFGWILGQECLAGLAYCFRNWRHMQMALSLSSLPLILLWFFIPESPRWLLTSGKTEDAKKEIERAARLNKVNPPNFQAILESVTLTKGPSKRLTLLDLMRGPKLRRTTFVVWFTYMASRILYFHLSFTSSLIEGNIFLNYAAVEIFEVPGKILGALAMKYFRRKVSIALLFFGAAGSYLLFLAFDKGSTWTMVSVCALNMFFTSAALEMLCVYAGELFPTSVRTMGLGSAYMVSRVGSTIAPFLSTIVAPRGVMEASLSTLQLLAAMSLMLVPETLHKRLPDTLEDAELPLR